MKKKEVFSKVTKKGISTIFFSYKLTQDGKSFLHVTSVGSLTYNDLQEMNKSIARLVNKYNKKLINL